MPAPERLSHKYKDLHEFMQILQIAVEDMRRKGVCFVAAAFKYDEDQLIPEPMNTLVLIALPDNLPDGLCDHQPLLDAIHFLIEEQGQIDRAVREELQEDNKPRVVAHIPGDNGKILHYHERKQIVVAPSPCEVCITEGKSESANAVAVVEVFVSEDHPGKGVPIPICQKHLDNLELSAAAE